jgi:hypothetical protein
MTDLGRELLVDQIAWIKQLLENLQTRTSVNPHNAGWNSLAPVEVPEWRLRQILQTLRESLASTEGR